MKIESEALRNAIENLADGHSLGTIQKELLGILDNLEQQQIDAPMGSQALWTSLGHHAELTYRGKHWTLRAFPGGFSAKCAETGEFHMAEAADLPSAMIAAEQFVMGDSTTVAADVPAFDSKAQDELVEKLSAEEPLEGEVAEYKGDARADECEAAELARGRDA